MRCTGFLLWWLLGAEHKLWVCQLWWSQQAQSSRLSGSAAWAQQLWHTGPVAPQRVEYSRTTG